MAEIVPLEQDVETKEEPEEEANGDVEKNGENLAGGDGGGDDDDSEDDSSDGMKEAEMKRNSGDASGYPSDTGTWDPNAGWRKNWDLLMMLLLLFCAFVTPFEISFIDTSEIDPLFIINQFINILFIIDVVLAFNTGYFSFELGLWITNRKMIIRAYARSWMGIDFVSCFPFDIISLIFKDMKSIQNFSGALRLVRLARLGKLLRILRASRILNRWATRISISFGMQLLYKCLLMTVVLTHWSACAIRMASKLSLDACVETYLLRPAFRDRFKIPHDKDYKGGYELKAAEFILNREEDHLGCKRYRSYKNEPEKQYDECQFEQNRELWVKAVGGEIDEGYWTGGTGGCDTFITRDSHMTYHNGHRASMWNQYVVSLNWSVTALKGTTESPRSNIEIWVGIWVMIIGGGVYTIMIGDVANVVSNLDEAGNAYKKTMDNLNMYMAENHFDGELQMKLRSYFFHCKAMLRAVYHKDTLMKMSPILRGEVAWKENSGWVLQIPFFKLMPNNEKEGLVTEVSLALEAGVFIPQDKVVKTGGRNDRLSIIDRGMVSKISPGSAPRLMGMGASFGDDIILHLVTDVNRPRKYSVTALTYVDVQQLSAADLKRTLESGVFPISLRRIRRAATKMLFQTFFVDELKFVIAKSMEDDDPIESMEELIARISAKLEKDRMIDPILRAQMGMIDQLNMNVEEFKVKTASDFNAVQSKMAKVDNQQTATLEHIVNKLAQIESKFTMQLRSLTDDVGDLRMRAGNGGGGGNGDGGHKRGSGLSRAQLMSRERKRELSVSASTELDFAEEDSLGIGSMEDDSKLRGKKLPLKNGVEFSAGVNTSLTDPMVEDPYLFDVNNEKTVENGRIHRTEVRKDMKEVKRTLMQSRSDSQERKHSKSPSSKKLFRVFSVK